MSRDQTSIPLSRWRGLADAAAAFVPSVLVGAAGAFVHARRAAWYDGLTLPTFAPPGWMLASMAALAPVVAAYAFHRVLRSPDWMPDRPHAIRGFAVLLGSSLALPLAVALRSPAGMVPSVVALLVATLAAARLFGRIDRRAGLFLWLSGLWPGLLTLVALSILIRN